MYLNKYAEVIFLCNLHCFDLATCTEVNASLKKDHLKAMSACEWALCQLTLCFELQSTSESKGIRSRKGLI